MIDSSGDLGIAAARAQADSELKKVLCAFDPDDFSCDLSAFGPFTHAIKLLFFEEAAELCGSSADLATFDREVRGL